ncbi:MAG: helix-turn-helix domain-containing protein [Lachnospiraceae bacterium]|nr:helix-turn-helix domain-containing protein [Lachnospiraceae bacterium]
MAFSIRQNVAQQIVEAVKDVAGHDINFIDAKGIIFASTDIKRIGDYHEIGHQVIKKGETIEVDSNEGYFGTKKGVNIPFIYKGDVCAVIGISGEPEEVRKYVYLAQKITALILREHELERQEHNQKTQLNHVIRSIINHDYLNIDYLKDFLKDYRTTLNASYQTILIKLDSRYNPSNLSMIEKYIYQAFESTGSKLYTFNYANEYILLMEAEKVEKCLYIFEELGQKYSPIIKIGVGRVAELSHQHNSYQSAKIAIESLFADEYIAVFDSLDLEILLGNVGQENKQLYLQKTIEKISEKDRKVLKTYFSLNMSLKDSCEQLFLHKNTLQYRLDKIWRDTGYNPREFKDAAVLYVGLKMLGNE